MGWREDSPHHMQDDAGNDNGWYDRSVHCSVDMIINISASLLMAPGTTTSLDWDMILTWDTGGHFALPRSSVVRCFAKFYLYPAFMNFASIDERWWALRGTICSHMREWSERYSDMETFWVMRGCQPNWPSPSSIKNIIFSSKGNPLLYKRI